METAATEILLFLFKKCNMGLGEFIDEVYRVGKHRLNRLHNNYIFYHRIVLKVCTQVYIILY